LGSAAQLLPLAVPPRFDVISPEVVIVRFVLAKMFETSVNDEIICQFRVLKKRMGATHGMIDT
jgi:hypothetical protein